MTARSAAPLSTWASLAASSGMTRRVTFLKVGVWRQCLSTAVSLTSVPGVELTNL